MDFQFQPVGSECFACHLRGKYGFFGVAYAGSVGQKLDMGMTDMLQHIIFFILQLYTFHGHRHHFRAGCQNGLLHDFIGIELSRSQKQAGVEFTSRND